MELADQQVSETEGLSGAEIPSRGAGESAVEGNALNSAADKPLSLREQIVKNVETVRTEEAKRARAADGKFTKIEAGAAETPATPTETPKPEANAQPTESNPVGPPSAWKGIWESMTPEARAIAVKREGEVAKGFEEYRGKVKQYEAIEQVLAPVRAVFQQQGISDDATAIRNVMSWVSGFENPATRVRALQDLVDRYRIDLSTLVPSSQPAAPSTAPDGYSQSPPVDYRAEISTLVQQQLAEQSTAQAIAAFAKDHPHFHKVSRLMGSIMQAGNANDLATAYQQAIEIHPEVSGVVKAERAAKEAEERAKADAEAKAAASEKARKAAAAAVSPSSRPPAGGSVPLQQGKKGIRDSILNAVNTLREEQRA
jgi:predicted metal-dependent HD superfamily phosphohydrolase